VTDHPSYARRARNNSLPATSARTSTARPPSRTFRVGETS